MYYSMRELLSKGKAKKKLFYNCVLVSKEFHLGINFIFNYCFFKERYKMQIKEAVRIILNKYDEEYVEDACEINCKVKKSAYKIWFMWWQGMEAMPDTVKACYNRLKTCSADYEVVLLSERNVNSYVNIDAAIMDKFNRNIILPAILSDYVRVSLLKKYGGLWLDASIYCMHEISGVEELRFLTGKKSGKRKWTSFFLAANETNNRLFTLLKYYFEKYWKEEVVLIDYFFTDFCIEYLYENHMDIREMIDNVEENNTEIFELLTLLSDPFDKEIYEAIATKHCFQKLSQKKDYRLYKKGKATFGNVLLRSSNDI